MTDSPLPLSEAEDFIRKWRHDGNVVTLQAVQIIDALRADLQQIDHECPYSQLEVAGEELAHLEAERDALRTALEERGHGPDCNFHMRFHPGSGYRCDCGFDELCPGVSDKLIAAESQEYNKYREALGGKS